MKPFLQHLSNSLLIFNKGEVWTGLLEPWRGVEDPGHQEDGWKGRILRDTRPDWPALTERRLPIGYSGPHSKRHVSSCWPRLSDKDAFLLATFGPPFRSRNCPCLFLENKVNTRISLRLFMLKYRPWVVLRLRSSTLLCGSGTGSHRLRSSL